MFVYSPSGGSCHSGHGRSVYSNQHYKPDSLTEKVQYVNWSLFSVTIPTYPHSLFPPFFHNIIFHNSLLLIQYTKSITLACYLGQCHMLKACCVCVCLGGRGVEGGQGRERGGRGGREMGVDNADNTLKWKPNASLITIKLIKKWKGGGGKVLVLWISRSEGIQSELKDTEPMKKEKSSLLAHNEQMFVCSRLAT